MRASAQAFHWRLRWLSSCASSSCVVFGLFCGAIGCVFLRFSGCRLPGEPSGEVAFGVGGAFVFHPFGGEAVEEVPELLCGHQGVVAAVHGGHLRQPAGVILERAPAGVERRRRVVLPHGVCGRGRRSRFLFLSFSCFSFCFSFNINIPVLAFILTFVLTFILKVQCVGGRPVSLLSGDEGDESGLDQISAGFDEVFLAHARGGAQAFVAAAERVLPRAQVALVEQGEVEEGLFGRKLVQPVHAPELVDEFDVVRSY